MLGSGMVSGLQLGLPGSQLLVRPGKFSLWVGVRVTLGRVGLVVVDLTTYHMLFLLVACWGPFKCYVTQLVGGGRVSDFPEEKTLRRCTVQRYY